MIDLGQYLAFAGVSLLVICTPGQDTALTIRNTLLGGRGAGVATSAGVSVGQSAWTIATSAGLAAILAASGPLFLAVRLAGAGYLLYLGARSLMAAVSNSHPAEHAGANGAHQMRPATAFSQGVLSNLSNAKMAVFFISLLPQFAGPHPSFLVLLALGLNFSLFTFVWLVAYTLAVERMGRLLRVNSIRRALDAVLGAVLTALGLRITAEALAG